MRAYVFTMHLQTARSAPLVLLFSSRPTAEEIATRIAPMVDSKPPGAHPPASRFQDVLDEIGIRPALLDQLFEALERDQREGQPWPSRERYHERATFSFQLLELDPRTLGISKDEAHLLLSAIDWTEHEGQCMGSPAGQESDLDAPNEAHDRLKGRLQDFVQ